MEKEFTRNLTYLNVKITSLINRSNRIGYNGLRLGEVAEYGKINYQF